MCRPDDFPPYPDLRPIRPRIGQPYRWQCEAERCLRGDRNDAEEATRLHPECADALADAVASSPAGRQFASDLAALEADAEADWFRASPKLADAIARTPDGPGYARRLMENLEP